MAARPNKSVVNSDNLALDFDTDEIINILKIGGKKNVRRKSKVSSI